MPTSSSNIDKQPLDLGIGRLARHIATLMATLGGCLAIAQLWWLPLSETSLWQAGRGVVLLLLAIGLMGTARLSLVLTLMIALTGLELAPSGATLYTAWIEPILIGATSLALATHIPHKVH